MVDDLHRPMFLPDLLAFAVSSGGDEPAIHLPDETVTYVQLATQISRFAQAYSAAGLTIGTPILFSSVAHGSAFDIAGKGVANPAAMIGFSDAGAHLRNMAFYNYALRLLKRAVVAERAGRPFITIEHAVHRLTGDLQIARPSTTGFNTAIIPGLRFQILF